MAQPLQVDMYQVKNERLYYVRRSCQARILLSRGFSLVQTCRHPLWFGRRVNITQLRLKNEWKRYECKRQTEQSIQIFVMYQGFVVDRSRSWGGFLLSILRCFSGVKSGYLSYHILTVSLKEFGHSHLTWHYHLQNCCLLDTAHLKQNLWTQWTYTCPAHFSIFLVLANQEATLISWLIESGVLKQVKH